MRVGTMVLFKGEEYQVVWIYDNATCEIKKMDVLGKVEIAAISELKVVLDCRIG
ncbi:hypothetical protein MOF32_18980 [Priestia megaterium]|uniref:hypothetical protein n=1 Tax=Priestia megaterium TaxID=1404 RepID=UPI002280F015|nr:hypothetical protein [Priestia megaterium]MCY9016601.1 hypothetical protein [Priestia megaterium]MCY9025002.1 hypothetical protein [Priestia megaterium]